MGAAGAGKGRRSQTCRSRSYPVAERSAGSQLDLAPGAMPSLSPFRSDGRLKSTQ